MTDAIERAARALLAVNFDMEYERVQNWAQRLKRDEARAAILAFLDAPEVQTAVHEAICGADVQWWDIGPDDTRAMTQAALSALRAAAGGER